MSPMSPASKPMPRPGMNPDFSSNRLLSVEPRAERPDPFAPSPSSSAGGYNIKPFRSSDYREVMGEIKPYAVLPENGIILDPARDQEEIPVEIATCLFNSTQYWMISTATHVVETRRQIQVAEMYWKSIVGAETSRTSGSVENYFANLLYGGVNPGSGARTNIPHHFALVQREGSVIAGVLGRVPNGEVQAFDQNNEDQVAAAEAANRLYTGLLNSINPEIAQLELIRSLWTGGTTFIRVHSGKKRGNPKVPVFTMVPYKQVIEAGRLTCANPGCGFNVDLVPVTSPPPPNPIAGPQPPAPPPPEQEAIPPQLLMQYGAFAPGTSGGMAGMQGAEAGAGLGPEVSPGAVHICPQCGQQSMQEFQPLVVNHLVTQEIPELAFPGHSVDISIENMLSVTVPVVNSLDEATWLMRRTFQAPAQVLSDCPQLKPYWRRMEARGSQAPSSWAFYPYTDPWHTLKNAVSEHTVNFTPRSNFWEVTELYLDPAEYACLQYDNEEGACGQWLEQRFPNGCKLVYVQGRLVKIIAANFHQEFFTVKADLGAGLYTQPMSTPTIAANRVANMMISMLLMTVKSGISLKFVKNSKVALEAVRAAAAGVNDIIPVADTVGDMKSLFYQTNPTAIPTGFFEILNFPMDSIRDVNGTSDTITGRVNVETTLGGDEMRLSRALMQHHPLWGCMREAWAKVGQSLVLQSIGTCFKREQVTQATPATPAMQTPQAAQTPQTLINENIVVGSRRGVPTLLKVTGEEQDRIKSGGWFVHIDEGIPLSPTQTKSVLMQLLALPPDILAQILLNDPRNIAKLQQYLLPSGFYTPGKDLMNRIQGMINILKQEVPPVDPLTGQPEMDPVLNVPKASRPISAIDLDPGACWSQVQAWCLTREAVVLRGTGEQPGPQFQNVINWGYLNKSYVDFQMAQQAQVEAEQAQAQAEAMGNRSGGGGGGGGKKTAAASAPEPQDDNRPSELLGASALNKPMPGMAG